MLTALASTFRCLLIKELDIFYLTIIALPILFGIVILILMRYRCISGNLQVYFVVGWNTLFTLFLLSLMFAAGETYYRFSVDSTDSFGLNKLTLRWGERHYQSNTQGARDNINYTLIIPEKRHRITFVGDSFTIGHGIKEVDDRFTNLLRRQHPEWDIHIMAANGFETTDELKIIEKIADIDYVFETVVLVYILNDISPMMPETAKIYTQIFAFNEGLSYPVRESYFLNFLAFRWFALRTPEVTKYYDFVKQGYAGEAWHRQEELLQTMVEFLRSRNCRLAVVTFPFLHNLPDKDMATIHRQLTAFWNKQQIPHLDLRPIFLQHVGEDLVVNQYDAHPNEHAHRIAAEAMAPFIEQLLSK